MEWGTGKERGGHGGAVRQARRIPETSLLHAGDDADDAVIVANAMLLIIGRALNMLKSQIQAQGKAFEETGGFSERLTAKRLEAREKDQPPAPQCPLCSKPMRRRNSAQGRFWGCSAFPDCKGTRPIERGQD